MNTSESMNNPFRNILGNIKDSFIVVDLKGNILSFNKSAAGLFFLPEKPGNILDYLNPDTAEDFNSLLLNIKEQSDLPVTANLQLHLKSGTELNCNIILNLYSEESKDFVLCTFLPEENIIQLKNLSELKLKTEEILSIINNEQIIVLLSEIRTHFPFTFVGREKIRKLIDKLDEFITVKDKSGIILLANKKYLNNLSLTAKQVEGKNENFFIPSYLNTLYESINRYVVDSGHCFTTEGIPFPAFQQEGFQNILIPLSDSENRVVAIISLTQPVKQTVKEIGNENVNSNTYSLNDFPFPVLVSDTDGRIRNTNLKFCNLFSVDENNIVNGTINSLLSRKFYEQFEEFISGKDTEYSFNYKFRSINKDSEEQIFIKNVKLKKVFNKGDEVEKIWLIFSEPETEDDLEKILKRRGRMFEVLIQKNPEPVFVYDKENLRFLEVNEAALNLYGYKREEFLQMDLTDLYTHEDIQTLLDSSSNAMKEGMFHGPFRHKKKDGSSVFVEISKTSFTFSGKDAHFNIVRDVTRKLDLEVQTQLFKAAFDNSNDLIFITDATGFITFTNQAVANLLGYKRSELEKNSFTSLVVDDERGNVNKNIFQSMLKSGEVLSTKLKTKNGESVEIKLTATPVLNYRQEVDSFNIIGHRLLTDSANIISDKTLSKVSDDNSISTDSVFLSSLFHEILTPMNVILGFVREITESMEVLTPEQKEASEIIDQNRSSLLNTMNLIIEYTNIQRNNYDFNSEEIVMTEVIESIQKDITSITQSRGVEFAYGKISSSLKFVSDKQKFQVLLSLIIKIVSRLSKEKKIYLSAYQFSEDNFIVSVKDNYAEVSSSLLEMLKNLFNPEDTSTAKDFGISKLNSRLAVTLLKLLGGRFIVPEFDSDKNECGFVFPLTLKSAVVREKQPGFKTEQQEDEIQISDTFDAKNYISNIPAKTSETVKTEGNLFEEPVVTTIEHEDKNKYHSTVDLSQLSCLYIEDQVDSQILFKVQLKELREIKFAVSFEEALPLLDQHHFDFIVMDINLQGEYNGLDALKIIHKMPQYETIPIIAVTAYVLPGDREKFITVGFNDFISKPIFRDKMLESLEKIF